MNAPVLNQFDPVNALALCTASRDAYSFSKINDPATDTHVDISSVGGDLIVAFRGTADMRNWLTDLDCEFDRIDGCKIHRGFYDAVDSVYDEVRDAIRAGKQRVWLTGHSLGGALAMVFAIEAFNRGRTPDQFAGIYTFGQPRVGNIDFRHLYDWSGLKSRTFRVVHADDLIPRVPWLLGDYRHAGHEVFYGDGPGEPPMIDPSLLDKLPFDARNACREMSHGNVALLADHHVNTYVNLFSTLAPLPLRDLALNSKPA